MCARREAGKQAEMAAGQSVTRRPTQRSPTISSISSSSSLAFHHQKYFRSVTQPAVGYVPLERSAGSLSVPLSRDLGRGETQGSGLRTRARSGRGVRALHSSNRLPRSSARASHWSAIGAAMTSETGVRSAPILVSNRRPTSFAGR